MDISDEIITYPNSSIKILDPILQLCWGYGGKLESKMSKMANNGISIPFETSHVRHRVLDDGISEYTLQIMQGKMPEFMVFFLIEPNRFNNESKLSSTKFERHGLIEFSMYLDNDLMTHYPLKVVKYGETNFFHEFYKRWLIITSNYGNSNEVLPDEKTYLNTNFMIVENFQDFENKDGVLSVKLKFDHTLSKKMYFCWCPTIIKTIKFDRNLSVQMV